jgi:hypothetical protein
MFRKMASGFKKTTIKIYVDFVVKKSIFVAVCHGDRRFFSTQFKGFRRFVMSKKVLVFLCVLLMAGMTVACQKKEEAPVAVEQTQEVAPEMDQAMEEAPAEVAETAEVATEAPAAEAVTEEAPAAAAE